MLRAADRPQERAWIAPAAVEAALARAAHLSSEQGEAVRHAAGSDGVAILEAGAGTGKTTTAKALVEAALASNLRVIGLAPSWVAADELSAATGIPVQALARWRHEQSRQPEPISQVDSATLVIVDEAGMVATRDMEAVLSAAQSAGAKVVLVGDRRQLASVGGASALRAVSEVVRRTSLLTEVRRQAVAWQRAASVVMARGDAEAGLRAYAARDQIELVSGPEAAQARVIALWREQRATYGEDVLIVTRRNRDAATLNAAARAALREEGRLGPDLAVLAARNREDQVVQLPLAVGDRLRFGESLPHLAVRNGNRAVVQAIRSDPDGSVRLRLQLEDGRVLDEPWQRLAPAPRFGRKKAPPRIVHAIAGTAHAAQGRTCAAAVLYLARRTDAREIYVGLTRHREAARVVVERERLAASCRQCQADPRLPAGDTAVLERLFREARSYSEKANVVDYAADRVAFLRDGLLVLKDRSGPDVRRAVRAARALREALAWLGAERLLAPVWRLVDGSGCRLVRSSPARRRALTTRIAAHLGLSRPQRTRQQDLSPER